MHQREATTQCEGPTCREWSRSHRGPRPGDFNERPHCGPHHHGPPGAGDSNERPNCGPHHRGSSHGNERTPFGPPPQNCRQTDCSSDEDEHPRCGLHNHGPPRHHGHGHPLFGSPPQFGPFNRSTSHFGPPRHHMGPMMSPLHHEQFSRGWPHHQRGPWDMRPHSCHHHHRCGHHRQDNEDRNNYYFIYVNRSTN